MTNKLKIFKQAVIIIYPMIYNNQRKIVKLKSKGKNNRNNMMNKTNK